MRVLRAVALMMTLSVADASRTHAQGAGATRPFLGSPHGGTPAGESREVSGRVVRGSRTALQPLAGAWVVLHRVGTDHAAPLDSMRTDAAGRYAFRYRTSGDPGAVYFVSNLYAGIAYFTAPLAAKSVSGEDAELVVHDTTSAPLPIRVRGRHVVIAAPGQEKRRAILEVYELSNDSTLTRVARGSDGFVWQAALLDGARNGRVGETDFSNGAVRFEQGRVRLAAPFAPGLKQFSFSYEVPVEAAYSVVLEERADVTRHLLAQVRPVVVHRQQHALDVESPVERHADAPERRNELGESFERVVLAVERDKNRIGGDQRVERQQAEGRRAVDDHVVEGAGDRTHEVAQTRLAMLEADQFDLGASQVAIGRND